MSRMPHKPHNKQHNPHNQMLSYFKKHKITGTSFVPYYNFIAYYTIFEDALAADLYRETTVCGGYIIGKFLFELGIDFNTANDIIKTISPNEKGEIH